MALGFDEIRLATPEDEEQVFDFLMTLHAENALFPVSPEKVRDAIKHATDRRGGVIALIEGDDGRIEASLGAVVEPWWYTTAPSLNEVWNYVRADCRQTNHAKRLIEFGKVLADQHLCGIPFFMGIISTERTEAKMRLYGRQLQQIGGMFAHGLERPALEAMRRGHA